MKIISDDTNDNCLQIIRRASHEERLMLTSASPLGLSPFLLCVSNKLIRFLPACITRRHYRKLQKHNREKHALRKGGEKVTLKSACHHFSKQLSITRQLWLFTSISQLLSLFCSQHWENTTTAGPLWKPGAMLVLDGTGMTLSGSAS